MEGGRRAVCASGGDGEEGTGRGASRHADHHGQPGVNVLETRPMERGELEMQVVETGKRVLGEEHPDTLISMGNLASTYRNQGRWDEAEELEVQVMETSKRVLGEGHPDTPTSMMNLAFT